MQHRLLGKNILANQIWPTSYQDFIEISSVQILQMHASGGGGIFLVIMCSGAYGLCLKQAAEAAEASR